MVRLHQQRDYFRSKKINVVVVVPENDAGLSKYLEKSTVNLNFVSDYNHEIAEKYGQKVKFLKLGRLPAQVLLDKNLNVVYEHHGSNMKDMAEESEIFKNI